MKVGGSANKVQPRRVCDGEAKKMAGNNRADHCNAGFH